MKRWIIGIISLLAVALASYLYVKPPPQSVTPPSARAAESTIPGSRSLETPDNPTRAPQEHQARLAPAGASANTATGIGPEPRYFQGQYANGNVLEQLMGSEAFEQDLAALGDAMSRDPDAAAFGGLQRQRLEDTLARGGLEARDVRIACGLRACLVQFTHGDAGRIDAWWRLFNTLPPPRAGVVMSQPRALSGGRWMHRVFLSFDPGVGGIRTRARGPGR